MFGIGQATLLVNTKKVRSEGGSGPKRAVFPKVSFMGVLIWLFTLLLSWYFHAVFVLPLFMSSYRWVPASYFKELCTFVDNDPIADRPGSIFDFYQSRTI